MLGEGNLIQRLMTPHMCDPPTCMQVLGEGNFIKRLMDFDKDNISDKVVRTIKRVIEDASFTPDQV